MEQIRTGDDDSSPDPPESPAALIQADPARPSTENFQYSDKSRLSGLQSLRLKLTDPRFEPPRLKPLFRGFERPSFSRIAILTTLCLTAYPAFYVLPFVAKDRSLFVVRAIVAVWCSGIGFALGYILLKIGARHLEAASGFTLVGYQDFLRLDFKQPGPP